MMPATTNAALCHIEIQTVQIAPKTCVGDQMLSKSHHKYDWNQ